MKLCTIDLGIDGGFTWITEDLIGNKVEAAKMPETTIGMKELIQRTGADYFVIETVQVRPNDQANGRLFNVLKMMRNRHQLETILEILEIPHFLITPQMWQKPYKEKIKGMEYAERKRFFRLKGQELFPKVKVVGWNADAIMILHYIERSRIAQTDWLKLKCRDVGIKLW